MEYIIYTYIDLYSEADVSLVKRGACTPRERILYRMDDEGVVVIVVAEMCGNGDGFVRQAGYLVDGDKIIMRRSCNVFSLSSRRAQRGENGWLLAAEAT